MFVAEVREISGAVEVTKILWDHDEAGEKCHQARGILTDLRAQADPG